MINNLNSDSALSIKGDEFTKQKYMFNFYASVLHHHKSQPKDKPPEESVYWKGTRVTFKKTGVAQEFKWKETLQ